MDRLEIQLIETVAAVLGYVLLFFLAKNSINNTLKKNFQIQRARRKFVIKAFHFFTTITLLVVLAAIWGLQQDEIAIFASTIITALGIAFFAQWSLLSNITAGVLLFFYHPIKIGDYIKVLDKENPFEGEVTDLTYFFVYLKNNDGDIITMPNSVILQKALSVVKPLE
jgi:small-conductance mechanosensitive channel